MCSRLDSPHAKGDSDLGGTRCATECSVPFCTHDICSPVRLSRRYGGGALDMSRSSVTSMLASTSCTCTLMRSSDSHQPRSLGTTPCSQCTTKEPTVSMGKPLDQPSSAPGT